MKKKNHVGYRRGKGQMLLSQEELAYLRELVGFTPPKKKEEPEPEEEDDDD
jgi:hypothetical protein